VFLQQTADLFPEHVPQRSFRLFFNAESFFLMQKTVYCCCYNFNVICGESPRHTWVYCVPCGVCKQRTLAKRKGHAKKNTPAIYLFHSDKVHLLNMHWSWDTTQYVSNLVVAFSNDYQPAFCRVCVFILWTSCLLINK